MHIFFVVFASSLFSGVIARDDPAPETGQSDKIEKGGSAKLIYDIEPTDDEDGMRTTRGPGGYTDDGETWSCLTNCEMKTSDCDAIQDTIYDMGDPGGLWNIPPSVGCNSWLHDSCKATFCPRDTAKDKDGNPIQEEMVVSVHRLAKQMRWLAVICAEEGRRAHMKADNGSWEFWLTEEGWEQS